MVIEVYTDGSGNSFAKPGGWAFTIVVDGIKVYENSGNEVNATNNTMELKAAVKGLEYVAKNYTPPVDVILVSDSNLVLGFASGAWNCKKLHLAVLANNLNVLYKQLNATQRWVKGHSGNEHNENCDVLAKAAREKLIKEKPIK